MKLKRDEISSRGWIKKLQGFILNLVIYLSFVVAEYIYLKRHSNEIFNLRVFSSFDFLGFQTLGRLTFRDISCYKNIAWFKYRISFLVLPLCTCEGFRCQSPPAEGAEAGREEEPHLPRHLQLHQPLSLNSQ